MAIKDQCDNCRKKSTDECTETIVYNGVSCSSYSRGINLVKTEDSKDDTSTQAAPTTTTGDNSEEFVYTSEYLKQNTEIHGWLSFFLFTVIAGGLLSVAYPLFTFNLAEYNNNVFLALADPLFGLMLFLLACYTFHAFVNRQPNAVFLAKMYIIAVFASNLIALLVGEYEPTGLGSAPRLVRSLIWSGIWFAFLLNSNNVEEVCPKEYRRKKNLDIYIAAAFIIYPLLIVAISLSDELSTRSNQEASLLQNVVLADNEYTDGRVVFARPSGFNCEQTEAEGVKFYNLECESVGSITLCSDYEDNRSEQNVRSYWNNWEDEDLKKNPSEVLNFETLETNGHPYYYAVKKYTIDDSELFWRFIMMFDYETGKACLISSYDGGYEEYLKELINSIRFK